MPLVCGVDSSTQSTKVEVRDLDGGAVVATGRAGHPAVQPPRSEQDPDAWWMALCAALAEVSAHLSDVVAISVAGQQHGMVVVGEGDRPLRPAKLWNDTESAPEAAALVARLGAAAWAERSGSVPVAAFTITKLAWLATHEPEVLAATERVLLPHDWLTLRLTGAFVTDRGDASGSGWWSPASGEVDLDLLRLVADRDWGSMVPEVRGPTEPAGAVTAEAAAGTGLRPGTLVGIGTGDNMAAALGLALEPADVVISLGTSGTAYAVSDRPTADATGAVAGFADATGRHLPLVCTLNATKVTDTFARLLGVDHAAFARLALDAGPGSGGLVLVPYLDGERTPNAPTAAGLLGGLTNGVDRSDVARAAHEGVLCGLLAGVEALAGAGVDIGGRRLLVGGGARSPAYPAIAADLMGREVLVPEDDEVVATGAAVQAAAAWQGHTPGQVAASWGLGAAATVAPSGSDVGEQVRARYGDLSDLLLGRSVATDSAASTMRA